MELSYQQLKDAIKLALCQRSGVTYGWYVLDLYDTYAIVEGPDDNLYSVTYTKTGGEGETPETVEVGADLTAVQRVIQYMPIAEALGGRLLEAVENSHGTTWRVLMIAPGLSKNGAMYPEAVLKVSAPLFEGVRALARPDADHLRGTNVDPKKLVGWFDQVSYVEGQGIVGTFNITADAGWLSLKLVSAWEKGKSDLLGFSIVAGGRGRRVLHEGKLIVWVDAIEAANFVDVVVNASAGGRLLEMVESDSARRGREQVHAAILKETAMLNRLLSLIESRHPELYAQIDTDNVTEDQLLELLESGPSEASTPAGDGPQAPPEPVLAVAPVAVATARETAVTVAGAAAAVTTTTPTVETLLAEARAERAETAQLTQQFQLRMARMDLSEALGQSNLPQPVTAKLQQHFSTLIEAGQVPAVAMVEQAIEAERTMLSQLGTPGIVSGLGRTGAQVTEDATDKAVSALENAFSQEHGATSFREAYVRATGDVRVTGRLSEAHNLDALAHYCEAQGLVLNLHESLTSTAFDLVLGDVINRRLLAEYARTQLNDWRQIVDIVPLNDFRTNHRTRFGGYGNLPIVGERASYDPLASPTNEEATYAPAKRGGTEDLTIEMIANDDVQAIRRIPINLGRAAAQTLHEFVFDLISTNPTVYDGVALFHVSHGNLHTAAWSTDAVSFFAHRGAMRQQTDMDSGKRLGILPAHVLIPGELENAVFDTFTQGDNHDEPFAKRVRPNVITVEYWTDPNNFYTVANPAQCPTIEVGFWDGEEPSLWIQEQPTVGSMFNNDTRTYKLRHVYGGTVLDYRGFQGSIVA